MKIIANDLTPTTNESIVEEMANAYGLMEAIRNSNFEQVKDYVLNKKVDVNALDTSLIPFFVHAINSQNTQIINFFLEQGAKVNPEHERVETTPLGAACSIAASASSVESMNYTLFKLIELNANLNPTNCLSSPLTEAIRANGPCSKNVAVYLLQKGANINPIIDNAHTPLSVAAKITSFTGELELFLLCLQLGAKINPDNTEQKAPLIAAIEANSTYTKIVAKYLIDMGATIYSKDMKPYQSPIHTAIRTQQKDIFELLLPSNTDKNDAIDINHLLEYVVNTNSFKIGEFIFEKYSNKNIFVSKDLFKICKTHNHSEWLKLFIKNGFDYTNECLPYITKSSSKIIQAVIDKYGIYPPAEHPQFKYGDFVIRTLDPQYSNEADRADNTLDKKKTCRLYIKDGLIYNNQGELFTTSTINPTTGSEDTYIWILDHHGNLFSTTMRGEISKSEIGNQHSFFSKKDGFGKPIACGGHFKVENGKIFNADPISGHYKPTKDQLILAIRFLYKKGVISDQIDIKYFDTNLNTTANLRLKEDILNINPEIILSKYLPLEGYRSSKADVTESNLNLYIDSSENVEVPLSGNNENKGLESTTIEDV